jgi:hypothetical protein
LEASKVKVDPPADGKLGGAKLLVGAVGIEDGAAAAGAEGTAKPKLLPTVGTAGEKNEKVKITKISTYCSLVTKVLSSLNEVSS